MKGHSLNAYTVNHHRAATLLVHMLPFSGCNMFEEFSKIVTGFVLQHSTLHNRRSSLMQCTALMQVQRDNLVPCRAVYAFRERVTGPLRPVDTGEPLEALALPLDWVPAGEGISKFLISIKDFLPVLRRGRPTLAVFL